MNILEKRNLKIVKDHWEAEDTKSLQDKNLQALERMAIINELKKMNIHLLGDIGCGDCEDTIKFSNYAERVIGYDYSEKMIREAKKNISKYKVKNIELNKLSLITDKISVEFEAIITKRTLINLGNFENQKSAIMKIHKSIRDNGYYFMLECSIDGLVTMNKIRNMSSIKEIQIPHHNYHFIMKNLFDFLKNIFVVVSVKYFSDYFYLTRIVGPLVNPLKPYSYDNLFKKLSEQNVIADQIGPQFLLVLRKK